MELLFPIIFLGLMWALLVRPQQQRMRRQRELLSSLSVGDRIVTVGGVIATIVALGDETARLEIAPGTIVEIVRPAVARRLEEDGATGSGASEPEDYE